MRGHIHLQIAEILQHGATSKCRRLLPEVQRPDSRTWYSRLYRPVGWSLSRKAAAKPGSCEGSWSSSPQQLSCNLLVKFLWARRVLVGTLPLYQTIEAVIAMNVWVRKWHRGCNKFSFTKKVYRKTHRQACCHDCDLADCRTKNQVQMTRLLDRRILVEAPWVSTSSIPFRLSNRLAGQVSNVLLTHVRTWANRISGGFQMTFIDDFSIHN